MDKPFDPRLLALVVHDLRNPLNVIFLTLRMIEEELPANNAGLADDVRMLKENAGVLDRMLEVLSEYCRLTEAGDRIHTSKAEPRRILEEATALPALGRHGPTVPMRLEVEDSLPSEATIDPYRARIALQLAIANAMSAAFESEVVVRSRAEEDRWITEVIVEKPPAETVRSQVVSSESFERLIGNASERRGLGLTLAASISSLFGGEVRIESEPESRSRIVLDWPLHVASA